MRKKRVIINKYAKTEEHHHFYDLPEQLETPEDEPPNWLTEKVTMPRWWLLLGIILVISGCTFNCHITSEPSVTAE